MVRAGRRGSRENPLSPRGAREEPRPAAPRVSAEDFRDFACCRAYDIISEGRYRQYLVRGRASSEAWALSMQEAVGRVQGAIKHVMDLVKAVESAPAESCLGTVCREVATSLSPPCRVRDGVGVCCITGAQVGGGSDRARARCIEGAQAEGCIDLSSPNAGGVCTQPPGGAAGRNLDRRGSGGALHAGSTPGADDNSRFMDRLRSSVMVAGMAETPAGGHAVPSPGGKACAGEEPTAWRRSESEFLVHPKFSHFFLMLWYVCKIEHIIRNYTRCWLEGVGRAREDEGGSDGGAEPGKDIASLCEDFAAQDDVLGGMFSMFSHGVQHVSDSLRAHSQPPGM